MSRIMQLGRTGIRLAGRRPVLRRGHRTRHPGGHRGRSRRQPGSQGQPGGRARGRRRRRRGPGTTVGATDQFLGLPYAAPPVGRLRWRPPQPAAHWSGVRDATQYGPHCPQPATPFGLASATEDCLYLNVFTPAGARAGGDHPVMVWIHGGGLWLGESQDYDPTKLVAQGTVVVTINYRLGALGWLAHPALAKRPGGPSGNYGWMDLDFPPRAGHRGYAARVDGSGWPLRCRCSHSRGGR
jgi:Carboxylesterase family